MRGLLLLVPASAFLVYPPGVNRPMKLRAAETTEEEYPGPLPPGVEVPFAVGTEAESWLNGSLPEYGLEELLTIGRTPPVTILLGEYSYNEMARLRECELKHGRVAMAAVLGLFLQPFFHPLAASCHIDAAIASDPFKAGVELPTAGKFQILGFCAFVEFLQSRMEQGFKYRPGDVLGTAYFLEGDYEFEEGWITYQNKELNNGTSGLVLFLTSSSLGRLAMVAFLGFVAQYALFGNIDDMLFKPLL